MWTAKLEGERESFQRAARTGAGARSPSSSTGPQDGGRASVRYNEQRSHGPLDGSDEGRKNKAKPLQLPLFYPLARL